MKNLGLKRRHGAGSRIVGEAILKLSQERDAAVASAAAMRGALQQIADVDKNREAFVMRGAFAMRGVVAIAQRALLYTDGAELLERHERAEAQIAALRGALHRAAKQATCCPTLPSGEHDPESCAIGAALADDESYECGQALLRRVKDREAERDRLAAELAQNETRRANLRQTMDDRGIALEKAEAERDAALAALRALMVVSRHLKAEIHRMATDGGGFSCDVIDDADVALRAAEALLEKLGK